MFKTIKKMTVISLAAIFFIGLDRFLKVFAFNNQTAEFNLFGEVLKFSYKANYYIAFSLPLSGPLLTIIIGVIILGLMYYWLIENKRGDIKSIIPLTFVLFGAISNMLDRIKFGFVIDYFDLKYFTVFNLADVMIVGGAGMLIIISLSKKCLLKIF